MSEKSESGFLLFPILLVVFLVLVSILVYYFYVPGKDSSPKESPIVNKIIEAVKPGTVADNREVVLGSKFQQPLEQLTKYNLPETQDIRGIVQYKNNFILTSVNGLFEFNPANGQIVRFNNPDKRDCGSNPVIINTFLYVSCRIANMDRYWDRELKEAPGFELIKVDLESGRLVKSYPLTGYPESRYNHKLFADGEFIWLATFDGLGRLNTNTDRLEFFHNEFNLIATQPGINEILVDKDFVWIYLGAHQSSSGGVVLYNKKTNQFKTFGPRDLKNNPDRFDMDFSSGGYAWTLIPGGIEIAFRDNAPNSEIAVSVKKYSYTTGNWEVVTNNMSYADSEKFFEKEFKSSRTSPREKRDEASQIVELYDPAKEAVLTTNFKRRKLQAISPVISGKRYVLTGSTIDVIDSSLTFPKIYITFNPNGTEGISYVNVLPWFFDEVNEKSILVSTNCGQGCTGTKVYYFDLKTGSVIAEKEKLYDFQNREDLFLTEIEKDISMTIEEGTYVIKNTSGKKLITISKANGEIRFEPVAK